jgi:radical SAM superfamily enzyme YgiQ (UPF0313 family)
MAALVKLLGASGEISARTARQRDPAVDEHRQKFGKNGQSKRCILTPSARFDRMAPERTEEQISLASQYGRARPTPNSYVLSQMADRVILADPPSPRGDHYATAFPNLGNLYLAASLRRELPHLDLHYIGAHHSFLQHLSVVRELAPKFYGLSFASPFAPLSFRLIGAVKEVSPTTKVICGGAHPTADPSGVLSSSRADVCCMGEGEETLVELLTLANSLNGECNSVLGTACKRTDGTIVLNPPRPYTRELSELPLPAWDLVDLGNYPGCRRSKGKPSMAMVASRGCRFDCTFCSNPVWRLQQPWLRKRSPENIAAEAEALYKLGIREIYIRSDEMNCELDWAVDVFEALSALAHPDLFFQCTLRAWPITPALARGMRQARCWLCHVGIESGSDRVLHGIRKGVNLEQIEAGLRVLRHYGIKSYAFMMLYQAWEGQNGLELESTREVFQSLRFIWRLRRHGLVDQMSWAFATPYPGAELYRVCQKYGLFRGKSAQEPPLTTHEITLRLPGVSLLQMVLLRSLGVLLQAWLGYRGESAMQTPSLLKHAMTKCKYVIRPW